MKIKSQYNLSQEVIINAFVSSKQGSLLVPMKNMCSLFHFNVFQLTKLIVFKDCRPTFIVDIKQIIYKVELAALS